MVFLHSLLHIAFNQKHTKTVRVSFEIKIEFVNEMPATVRKPKRKRTCCGYFIFRLQSLSLEFKVRCAPRTTSSKADCESLAAFALHSIVRASTKRIIYRD